MKKMVMTIMLSTSLVGCSTVQTQPPEILKGEVYSVYHYQVEESRPSVGGGLVGAGVGGLLGNQVGKGSGRTAMTVLGTVLGAGLGSAAAGGTKTVDMAELVIALDNGKAYKLTFIDRGWYVGQRVVLQFRGNQFKLVPA